MRLTLQTAALLLTLAVGLPAQQIESASRIGFRYDRTHVVVQLAQSGTSDIEGRHFVNFLEKMPLADARVAGIVSIGTSKELMERFHDLFAGVEAGQAWTIEADGHRYPAKVETLAFTGTGCQQELNAATVLAVDQSDQAAFAALANSTFLVWPAAATGMPDQATAAMLEPKAKLGMGQSATLKGMLNTSMRAQLDRLAHSGEGTAASRSAAAARLAKGQGKLEYEAQRLRLGPAGEERIFVRAKWMLGDYAAFVMSAWADPKRNMALQGVNGRVPEWLNQSKPQFRGESDADTLDEVLGVFAGQNGWGAVVIGHHELDGYVIELMQYTPRGPERTDVAYGYGC